MGVAGRGEGSAEAAVSFAGARRRSDAPRTVPIATEACVPVAVNADDVVRAESDRMFASFLAEAGGVNRLLHRRIPTPVENQPVIPMNRHTLYSVAVADLSEGARLTIPEAANATSR
jgi:hypothetical protein